MRTLIVDNHFRSLDPEYFNTLERTAFTELAHLSAFYPKFIEWYAAKVRPGLASGERKLLLRYVGGQLGGIAIIKDALGEKKLCCLRVFPHLQGSGLGLRLFSDAFDALHTEKPLLSVAEEQQPQFKRVFDHFGFEVGQQYRDIYRPQKTEYSYNGLLAMPI